MLMRELEGKEIRWNRISVGDVSNYCPMTLKECQVGVKRKKKKGFYGKKILVLGMQKRYYKIFTVKEYFCKIYKSLFINIISCHLVNNNNK